MENILKKSGLLLLTLLTAATSWAQAILTGTVYEDFGGANEPMMGVNIAVVNEQNRTLTGTITDMDGNYSIKMPAGNKLSIVFSFIGMASQRFAYTGQKKIDVTMKEDSKTLSEVVVATERTARSELGLSQRQFSGASQSIKMDMVTETLPVTSVEEALQGQMAGVDILASGDAGHRSTIRIRGTASLNGSTDPLIVINGVPYNTDIADDFDFSTANTEDFADMLSLNPADIESIEVLKDASSTAMYGTSGANGVLLITTKKGERGKPKFTFNHKSMLKIEPDAIPMLSGNEYTAYMQDAIWNTANAQGLNGNTLLTDLFGQEGYAISYQPDWSYFNEYNANTDWVDAVRKNAYTTDNNFSMSGGGDKATYRFSLGWMSEDGTTKSTDMTRLTSSLRIGYKFSERIDVNAEFTYSDTKNTADFFGSSSLRTAAQRKMPNKSPYYIDDATGEATDIYFTYQDENEFQGAYNSSSNRTQRLSPYNYHPIAAYESSWNNTNTKEEKVNISPRIILIRDEDKVPILQFSGYVSMKFKTVKTNKYLPQQVTGVDVNSPWCNYSLDGYTNNFLLQTNSLLTYHQIFKEKHDLSATAKWFTQQSEGSTYSSTRYGVANGHMYDPVNSGTISSGSVNSGNSNARKLSAIGSLSYTFDQWLTLNAVVNYEGSSSISKENRWGVFPSFGVTFNMQDFKPLKQKTEDWLSQLKLRASWGQTGNAPSGTSPYVGTYTAANSKYGSATPIVPNNMQLTELKWETTTEWDLGIDLGFWGNKLAMTFDYYDKTTDDLLQKNVPVSTTSAYSKIAWTNSGKIQNKGWEYRIDYEIFKNKEWQIKADFNIARNYNEILELPSNLDADSYSFGNGNYALKYIIGTPTGSFFGYRYLGVYQNLEDTYAKDVEGNVMHDLQGNAIVMHNRTITCYPGDAKYEDINHDGVIDENDIVYIGNCNPSVTGGFGLSVKYNDWTLTTRFNYRLGQKVINSTRMNNEAMYYRDNQSKAVLRRWRAEGDNTDIPRALYNYGYNYLGSDRFVEDCSYIRVQTITLNYRLPKKICQKFHAASASVFVTGYDLFTFTDYKGQDPEVNLPKKVTDLSMDDSTTPRTRRIAMGATINF